MRAAFTNRILSSALVTAGLLLTTCAAHADSFNLATGLDASDNRIASGGVLDAHWTFLNGSITTQAQTVFPGDADSGFIPGGWVANGPNSDWIAKFANSSDQGQAPYTFTRTFDLTGYDLNTVSLSGLWTLDDTGTLDLNGVNIGSLGVGNWTSLHPFSVATGSSVFHSGINTLNINITNSDRSLEGARLEGTLSGNKIPEPASLALLLGVGVPAVLGRRRRK